MLKTSLLSCGLDLDSPGKRIGCIDLHHSDEAHAFGVIPLPLAVIKGGQGPTLLLMAGNHGDEYEGQVILRRLIEDLVAEEIQGRLLILPALNTPAMLADRRTSPLDGGNMNRSFPGSEENGPTAAIAHFVTERLLPLADAAIDFHSGGKASVYPPLAYLCDCADAEVHGKSLALAEAFGAPFTLTMCGTDAESGFDPVAHARGVACISTELSGGGGVDHWATGIGRDGLARIMGHLGMLPEKPERAPPPTRYLEGRQAIATVSAPISGLFEPLVAPGDSVRRGDEAGWLYPLEELGRPAMALRFEADGVVIARRCSARAVPGSYLYMTAPEVAREDVVAAEPA